MWEIYEGYTERDNHKICPKSRPPIRNALVSLFPGYKHWTRRAAVYFMVLVTLDEFCGLLLNLLVKGLWKGRFISGAVSSLARGGGSCRFIQLSDCLTYKNVHAGKIRYMAILPPLSLDIFFKVLEHCAVNTVAYIVVVIEFGKVAIGSVCKSFIKKNKNT